MASADLSEFYKLSRPKSPPCQLGLVLAGEISPKLSDEEVKQLDAALKADKQVITSAAIWEWLKRRKVESNAVRIANHRRGVCSCAKD